MSRNIFVRVTVTACGLALTGATVLGAAAGSSAASHPAFVEPGPCGTLAITVSCVEHALHLPSLSVSPTVT